MLLSRGPPARGRCKTDTRKTNCSVLTALVGSPTRKPPREPLPRPEGPLPSPPGTRLTCRDAPGNLKKKLFQGNKPNVKLPCYFCCSAGGLLCVPDSQEQKHFLPGKGLCCFCAALIQLRMKNSLKDCAPSCGAAELRTGGGWAPAGHSAPSHARAAAQCACCHDRVPCLVTCALFSRDPGGFSP